jgi:hypothetical protein
LCKTNFGATSIRLCHNVKDINGVFFGLYTVVFFYSCKYGVVFYDFDQPDFFCFVLSPQNSKEKKNHHLFIFLL